MIDQSAAIEMLRNELIQHQQGVRGTQVHDVLEATMPHNVISGPSELTDEMIDAPRGMLQLLYQGSLSYKQIKRHLEMRGDDLGWWPAFADEYEGKMHITKAGMAILLYRSMTAVANNPTPSN